MVVSSKIFLKKTTQKQNLFQKTQKDNLHRITILALSRISIDKLSIHYLRIFDLGKIVVY